MSSSPLRSGLRHTSALLGVLFGVSACSSDSLPTNPRLETPIPANALVELTCTGSVQQATVACQPVSSSLSARANVVGGTGRGVSKSVIGGQNLYVRLTSSNVSYDAGTEVFQFDVTVQNLLNEPWAPSTGSPRILGGSRFSFINHRPPPRDPAQFPS